VKSWWKNLGLIPISFEESNIENLFKRILVLKEFLSYESIDY